MKLGIYGDHKVFKVQITDNTTKEQKTRVLKTGKIILTEKESFKLAKAI